jgi:hypothetical protein
VYSIKLESECRNETKTFQTSRLSRPIPRDENLLRLLRLYGPTLSIKSTKIRFCVLGFIMRVSIVSNFTHRGLRDSNKTCLESWQMCWNFCAKILVDTTKTWLSIDPLFTLSRFCQHVETYLCLGFGLILDKVETSTLSLIAWSLVVWRHQILWL